MAECRCVCVCVALEQLSPYEKLGTCCKTSGFFGNVKYIHIYSHAVFYTRFVEIEKIDIVDLVDKLILNLDCWTREENLQNSELFMKLMFIIFWIRYSFVFVTVRIFLDKV